MRTLDAARTLVDVVAARAHQDPSRRYFELYGETTTYGALWELARCHAAGLAARGIGPGDKVAILLPTCKEFFSTFFGVMALGAVPVPLYPTMGSDALAAVFAHAETSAVVTISWFEARVREARTTAPRAVELLEPDALARSAPEPRWPALSGEETAFLQYTSGSTGEPKGVDLPHRSVLANVRAFVRAAGAGPEDTAVSWLPLYHDMGLIGLGFGTLYAGCALHLMPPDLRNPRQWLEAVTRARAAFTASPDFGYRNCLRNVHDLGGLDLSSLRVAFTGAEPIRAETVREFEERFGLGQVVLPAYGLAEATLAVALGELGRPIRVDPSGRWVGVGRPIPGVEVGIWADDPARPPGRFLEPDEVGEIVVRTPAAMRGYYRDPDATRHAFRSGWLHTGDLGYLAPDGYLFVVGRQKDVIVVRGENVMPLDIERIVDALPGVRYAAAIGLDSPRIGTERLVIVVEVRDPQMGAEEASALLRTIVSAVHAKRSLRPARVLLVRPGTIPKTTSGKIQHARLGAVLAGSGLGDAIVYPTRPSRGRDVSPPEPSLADG